MTVIKRGEVPAPVLPKETVEVEALGGEVVVRGMLLTERLAVQKRITSLRKAEANGLDDVHAILPVMLALCVLDADGLPVFTQDQWQTFGAEHAGQAVALFNTAWRLSGFDTEAEAKN